MYNKILLQESMPDLQSSCASQLAV